MVATLEDLEARVAALEASQADDHAVLAEVNALGANQRDQSLRITAVETGLTDVKTDLSDFRIEMADFRQETQARIRSVDEHLAEIKDLIIGGRNNPQG